MRRTIPSPSTCRGRLSHWYATGVLPNPYDFIGRVALPGRPFRCASLIPEHAEIISHLDALRAAQIYVNDSTCSG